MLPRRTVALLSALVTAAGLAGLAGPASAGVDLTPVSNVSHAEYRAISKAMTRAQVVRVTHRADFDANRAGACSVRFYKGWDRDHAHVAVVFDSERLVQEKATTGRNGAVSFLCTGPSGRITSNDLSSHL